MTDHRLPHSSTNRAKTTSYSSDTTVDRNTGTRAGRSQGARLDRRQLLKLGGLAVTGMAFARLPVMAGPFAREDFTRLVPADKKLDPAWAKSLFERGTPEVLRGADLKYVGMPVGGICSGQLYLGGDGRFWHWDIFNQHQFTGYEGPHYKNPPAPDFPVEQGFALRLGGKNIALDHSGFSDIRFRGEYPIGHVEYRDPAVPLAVTLEAFSPFIPLNTDDSSLPATVMRFTLTNTSTAPVEAELVGILENAVLLNNRDKAETSTRRNRIVAGKGHTLLECLVDMHNPPQPLLEKLPDLGTMGLALLGRPAEISSGDAERPVHDKLVGEIGRKLTIAAGESAVVAFVLAWHFPNLKIGGVSEDGRHYAAKFPDAAAVAGYVAENIGRLEADTRLWRDTWYDSTLPHWFLDRTQINTSTLATSTCYRLKNGRFWAWEGVGCCPGTCGHVWHYAHAMARLFPELERILRERTDFGLALQPDGAIRFRCENNDIPAIDAQSGAILRTLREHQMSTDDAFLRRVWPGVKRATDWLIAKDGDGDGIIDSNQHNTLDTDWFGQVAWLSGLYQAALAASATLADELGETAYAGKCRAIQTCGQKNLVAGLFDGEYFINKVDPKHIDEINSGTGCGIDQVMGQSWAFQVGLPRVLPEKETRTALRSLWKYNFSPDVGPYRESYKAGRWYAMAGEAGLLMCSFPRTDWDFKQACGKGDPFCTGYFNECMNGFEYQVAGHMLWEGMVMEGLAITRAVHDRYHASKRNPWNEVECGDHYARSMASYGVYLAACGYEYHGPKAHIGFAPRLTPEDFKCAFTAAEGWGTYSQRSEVGGQKSEIRVKWGRFRLRTISIGTPAKPASVTVKMGGTMLPATLVYQDGKATITLAEAVTVAAGQSLELAIN